MGDPWTVSGWWIGLIGTVLGLIGIGYGIWARAFPKRTQLEVRVKQQAMSVPNDPKLQVLFDGRKLARPTVVEVTIEHLGGPEIARADMPAGSVSVGVAAPVLVGPLGRAEQYSRITEDGKRIEVKPYLVREFSLMRLRFLADGDSVYTPSVRIANVAASKGPWLRRHQLWAHVVGYGLFFAGAFGSEQIAKLAGWPVGDWRRVFLIVLLAGVGVGIVLLATLRPERARRRRAAEARMNRAQLGTTAEHKPREAEKDAKAPEETSEPTQGNSAGSTSTSDHVVT